VRHEVAFVVAAAMIASPAAGQTRVDDLVARMTLEEKVGQMTQLTIGALAAPGVAQRPDRIVLDTAKLREAVVTRHVGSVLNVLDGALPLDGWRALVRQIQDEAVGESRLGIPVLYGIDFVHGANYVRGAVIFPHNIGMAATFDPTLARAAAAITGREALAAGVPWVFAPVLDVGRQPLWPRFYETFGEDPYVGAQLGQATIDGLQASGQVAATMKHYVAYSGPRSGRDRTPADLSERDVREHFLPPFRAAVAAGAMAVMLNSGEIDGMPVHASHHWLTEVLRGELGFQGIIVTDWNDVTFLHTRHHVATNMSDAVRMAVDAGIDMCMTPDNYDFADELVKLVRAGVIPERRIDESVRRILQVKERLGLFEHPVPAWTAPASPPDADAVAGRAARESITLLKNDGVLPLRPEARVLVTGPAAASLTALNGGWTYTWQGTDSARFPAGVPTVLDAIRRRSRSVRYVLGAGFTAAADINAAAAAARTVDVAVVVLGEDAYAEWFGDISDLTLPAAQLRLASAVAATGTPTVVVLVEGRPRIIREIVAPARGIVLAYWPGMAGADAIADVLFGVTNPSGKLPFTYPKYPNALIPYDHKFTETLNAAEPRGPGGFDPQWEFGSGLSYTTFQYHDLTLDRETFRPGDRMTVTITITNTGARAGRESVLLFTHQQYAALTPAVRRLRGFESVELPPGASAPVTFTLTGADLQYVGQDGRSVLEPGQFDVMVGGLTSTFTVIK
jgi:beta-glucosidase